ncbi:MAG: ABC transporter substrate-binding protein [Desulfobacteraceae bacterium]
MGLHVSSMKNLDPHFAAGSQDRAFADMVFNGLLRYKPGKAPEIEPDLAQEMPEFVMRGQKQVWTFNLRRGILFHSAPGIPAHELTAEDVVFSLQKSADPERCRYSGEYKGMTFSQTNRYTVEIVLDDPMSTVLFFPKFTDYGGGFIISRRAVEKMGGEKFRQHPVGTGPFAFQSHDPGKKIVLNANDTYFRGRPCLKGVEIFFTSRPEDREKKLLSGDLDVVMGSAEKGWIERMIAADGIEMNFFGVGEVVTFYFNTCMAPLDDIRVRKAIAHALDQDVFMATSHKRIIQKIYSPVPAHLLPGGLTRKEALGVAYATDLKKSRSLLTEAGYPHGFDLDLVSSEKRLHITLNQSLADQLARIGIQCRLHVKKHADMHKLIRHQPYPIVLYVAWRPNADQFLTRFFHSNSIIVKGSSPDTNFSHYDKIDALIEDARREINPEKQIDLWKHAQIKILSDAAAYPVMAQIPFFARKANVDYGHELISTLALYPQFTEKTRIQP